MLQVRSTWQLKSVNYARYYTQNLLLLLVFGGLSGINNPKGGRLLLIFDVFFDGGNLSDRFL